MDFLQGQVLRLLLISQNIRAKRMKMDNYWSDIMHSSVTGEIYVYNGITSVIYRFREGLWLRNILTEFRISMKLVRMLKCSGELLETPMELSFGSIKCTTLTTSHCMMYCWQYVNRISVKASHATVQQAQIQLQLFRNIYVKLWTVEPWG